MEHNRPEGLGQGYFCMNCGGQTSMMGHYNFQTDERTCEPNPELVATLVELNK